jgi:hypothetical protein
LGSFHALKDFVMGKRSMYIVATADGARINSLTFETRDEAEQLLAMLQNSPPPFSDRELTVREVTSGEWRALSDPLRYDGRGRVIDRSYLAGQAPPKEVGEYLLSFGSYQRTEPMYFLMLASVPRRCLQIFLEWGNTGDAPWGWRSHLSQALRRSLADVALTELLSPDKLTFYTRLPDPTPIWRGCERDRQRGLYWTTSRAVAEDFARGVRCINKNPTLVTAEIPKQHIFAVFTERQEDEVVVDYRRLRRLKTMPIAK